MDAIDGLAGVSASMNEASGGIDVWSETTGGSLTMSDTSGVLAALGMEAGTYVGAKGSSTSTTTLTGNTTVSNSIDVAANVSSAVTQLNEALTALGTDGLKDALESAIDRLRDAGVRGLQVTGDGADVSVTVERDDLVNALNALGDDVDLAKEIGALFEELTADVAAAAGWDAEAATVQSVRLSDTSRALLAADQTATSLLYLRSSLQPQESVDANQKAAMKAYGETP